MARKPLRTGPFKSNLRPWDNKTVVSSDRVGVWNPTKGPGARTQRRSEYTLGLLTGRGERQRAAAGKSADWTLKYLDRPGSSFNAGRARGLAGGKAKGASVTMARGRAYAPPKLGSKAGRTVPSAYTAGRDTAKLVMSPKTAKGNSTGNTTRRLVANTLRQNRAAARQGNPSARSMLAGYSAARAIGSRGGGGSGGSGGAVNIGNFKTRRGTYIKIGGIFMGSKGSGKRK